MSLTPRTIKPVELPRKIQKLATTKKRFVVLIGGRGSGKSTCLADVLLRRMYKEHADCLCLREHMNTIDDSVHKLFKGRAKEYGYPVSTTDTKVAFPEGNSTKYRGAARNPDGLQSAQDFKYSWFEEAHTISDESLKKLIPTIRSKGSQLFFSANPQSREDPFSKRFIVPYETELLRDGYYEDELHLIIVVNWRDNPWFPEELQQQREWDEKHLSKAEYEWIWEGAFNDSVDNALIEAEWFDACIDAHKTLGIKPQGAVFSAHDPSDTGGDHKGYAMRHGIVVMEVDERTHGDSNEGADWACGLANQHGCDYFLWDCDGLGVSLNRQVVAAFKGKRVDVMQFKGSRSPENPESLYKPATGATRTKDAKNKQIFKNQRAQYYVYLRDRIYNTFRAVVHKEYIDPEQLISFSSDITHLKKLRSELCRLPVKPNTFGMIQLYTKQEMLQTFQIPSPNLADSVMMLWPEVLPGKKGTIDFSSGINY